MNVKNKELVVSEESDLTFRNFFKGYAEREIPKEDMQIVYLIGVLGQPIREVAKTLKLSKQKVVDKSHELKKLINEVRFESKVAIVQKYGASKLDLETAKAKTLGKIIEEINKRLEKEDSLSKIPLNKLVEQAKELSSDLSMEVEHETSYLTSFYEATNIPDEWPLTYKENC